MILVAAAIVNFVENFSRDVAWMVVLVMHAMHVMHVMMHEGALLLLVVNVVIYNQFRTMLPWMMPMTVAVSHCTDDVAVVWFTVLLLLLLLLAVVTTMMLNLLMLMMNVLLGIIH